MLLHGALMKVRIPTHSGFCPGVKKADRTIEKLTSRMDDSTIYVLGSLIHNSDFIESLAARGVITVSGPDDIPDRATVIIRTHGVDRAIEERLRGQHEVIDLTCGKVKKLQKLIQEHADNGYFSVITGKPDHPEVVGLCSYAERFAVISNMKDCAAFESMYMTPHAVDYLGEKPLLVVSQTTGNTELFSAAADLITRLSEGVRKVEVCNSICPITSVREKESIELQRNVDITIVVGDRMSANANKLFDILRKHNDRTFFVKNLAHLKAIDPLSAGDTSALVVSSSSTPGFIEQEIVSYLESRQPSPRS
jgi:(E)-4-hydroxy-3-methyl-but-2-enyl pyrophosphate reductase